MACVFFKGSGLRETERIAGPGIGDPTSEQITLWLSGHLTSERRAYTIVSPVRSRVTPEACL